MMDVRKHGDWKPLDWLWLAPFVLVASLWPSWRRQYWNHYVTTSVLTGTIYTPTGAVRGPVYRHEQWHMEQRNRDGLVVFALRYVLSTRWRIWYEAEAYFIQGLSADETVDALQSMYLVRWPRLHILGLVLWARSCLRVRGFDISK